MTYLSVSPGYKAVDVYNFKIPPLEEVLDLLLYIEEVKSWSHLLELEYSNDTLVFIRNLTHIVISYIHNVKIDPDFISIYPDINQRKLVYESIYDVHKSQLPNKLIKQYEQSNGL